MVFKKFGFLEVSLIDESNIQILFQRVAKIADAVHKLDQSFHNQKETFFSKMHNTKIVNSAFRVRVYCRLFKAQ